MIKKVTTYIDEKEGFEYQFEPVEDSISITKIKEGYEVKYMITDDNPNSPRENDNIGIMVCFHSRHTLGDNNLNTIKSEDFNSWEEIKNYIIKTEKAICMLPLYLYDHSGISIKVGSFQGLLPQGHAEFDSGQVGFIYTTKEQLKIMGVEKESKKQIAKYLTSEVETYNKYLTGDSYSIVKEVYNHNKEQINYDMVGGFLGYEDTLEALKTEI